MDDQLVLKNRLKVARAEKNLSQGDLAKLVGVSRQTISSIETGQFNPTAKLALVLCIALDKKFEDLFYNKYGAQPLDSLLFRRIQLTATMMAMINRRGGPNMYR